jgi:HPt (histidine-containing phosphotransfer) domain-containing protein
MSDLPFDRAAVLENLGGDESLLAEIAGIFINDWSDNLVRLREAVAAGDAEALRHAAHSVKGSVANFSAERAVQAARDLEYAGRDGNLAQAPQLLETTIAAVEEVIAALKADASAHAR